MCRIKDLLTKGHISTQDYYQSKIPNFNVLHYYQIRSIVIHLQKSNQWWTQLSEFESLLEVGSIFFKTLSKMTDYWWTSTTLTIYVARGGNAIYVLFIIQEITGIRPTNMYLVSQQISPSENPMLSSDGGGERQTFGALFSSPPPTSNRGPDQGFDRSPYESQGSM